MLYLNMDINSERITLQSESNEMIWPPYDDWALHKNLTLFIESYTYDGAFYLKLELFDGYLTDDWKYTGRNAYRCIL